MKRLVAEDAVGQLLEKRGTMADLASENGRVMLDWVDGLPRMLQMPDALEEVEDEARAILERGIRYVIWAGMGGSVMTVCVLAEMLQWPEALTILPLDSTDPAALNSVVQHIAHDKGIRIEDAQSDRATLHRLLDDVLMVAVAMGMTSEEPITHLQWFVDLVQETGMAPRDHALVMSLPGSYLDVFAREHELPVLSLQLDGGNGTGGRMSAPTTRVFLLPAALVLVASGEKPGTLRRILSDAWQSRDFGSEVGADLGVRIGAMMADAASKGTCRLLLDFSEMAAPLLAWIEQLMEESLGKGGRGVLVFDGRTTPWMQEGPGVVRVGSTWLPDSKDEPWPPHSGLQLIAEAFLQWQMSMALYGYLNDIPFAGQPAVENYKARARALRERGDPLGAVRDWQPRVERDGLTVLLPAGAVPSGTPAESVASALRHVVDTDGLQYLDVTMNGEWPAGLHQDVTGMVARAAERLGTCFKVRRAPAAYHSTEQSEMDGPSGVFSIRIATRQHEDTLLGAYDDTFLLAQAVGTWQAMNEASRWCCLVVFEEMPDRAAGRIAEFVREALEVRDEG